jgi:hypothetical protein
MDDFIVEVEHHVRAVQKRVGTVVDLPQEERRSVVNRRSAQSLGRDEPPARA